VFGTYYVTLCNKFLCFLLPQRKEFFLNLSEGGQLEAHRHTGIQPYYISYTSLKDELNNNISINIEKTKTTERIIGMKLMSLSRLSNSKERSSSSRSTHFSFQYLEEQ